MKIGICDDEKQQRTILRRMIMRAEQLLGIESEILEFEDGISLVLSLSSNPELLDVLFLDIEMGSVNGVDTARDIRRYTKDMILIFVTGYADYVFNGYEVEALDYVLKQCKDEKIQKLLQRILERIDKRKESFLSIQSMGKISKIPISSIQYITSDLRKVIFVTKSGQITCYGKLGEFEMQLSDHFIRIHKQYLVNLNYVDYAEADSVQIGSITLPVSKRRSQDVMAAFARNIIEGDGFHHV